MLILGILGIMHIVLCDELQYSKDLGLEASIGDFPGMVSVQSAHLNTGHICCGTIVNSHFVVSSASCYAGIPQKVMKTLLFVVIDPISISPEENGSQQILQVKKIIYHSEYNNTPMNDIALIYVRAKIKYTKYITTNVAIANTGTKAIESGTICQTAGWVVLNNYEMQGSKTYSRLLKYDIEVADQSRCECSNKSEQCYQNGFCVTAASKNRICLEFGGNPLICDGALFGIRSAGKKCISEGNGIIFMTIAPYFLWISSIVSTGYRRLIRLNTSNSLLPMSWWILITATVTLKL